ncbi:MAG: DNA polymerase III subunit alpha [Gemmatimonadetes bacterium]|nr:DNA polymerase III subunit alpha [Gemmatimonadota bacterium]
MFTHLHVHSWFSFGAGVSSPEVLARQAAARGFTALACTDTNGVYGAVEFQQAALAHGLRPIHGAHLVHGGQEVVALATDERGWAALCRAITHIHWADEHREAGNGKRETGAPANRGAEPLPRGSSASRFPLPVSRDLSALLATDRAGLLLLSQDIAFLEDLVRRSGPVDVYGELRPGKHRHAVLAAAQRLGLSCVVTGGVMFANAEDWARHRLRVAIARNAGLEEDEDGTAVRRYGGTSGEGTLPPYRPTALPSDWLRPADDLARHFPDRPDAMLRAEELAERCGYRIPVGARVVAPRFADTTDALLRLRALAWRGAERRYGMVAPITRDRLEHELTIIAQKGFADYFLVVHDIVQHGPTHCGRGSVANSIVSYCLGITHVDPLGAGLLFERFLNPERKDPPDIDLDFPWDERDQILAWVFRRYPRPRAAMVANHNCFRLRGALREVAKVYGRPPGEIREVTRRFPWFSEDESIGQLLATHPNFQGLNLPAVWQELARAAEPLVGTPRHLSLHPGGVVIVPQALTDYVPLEPAAKRLDGHPDLAVPVIQFEKDGAEDAGLVKIDLLGNRSLAVIRDAIAEVRVHTGRRIDYTADDPDDDAATRALFRTGQTMGVFYTESPASRLLCAKSRAESFELLVLNTSIIRPASNRFIRVYLERLHGAPYQPLDPSLQDTLAETFGVMVYQEDVVNVCAAFAGLPLATGDGVRKALSKKRPVKALAAYAAEFFAGAARLGRDPDTATKVWEMVLSFAGYSFCKGHSCSYIKVAQHSCYLRAHYPAEFMAAVLANGGGFYRPFAYVAEAMRMGLTVRPPDVNASRFRTTGGGREVRIGFQFIKGLSADAVERIETAKGEAGNGKREAGPMGRSAEAPPHRGGGGVVSVLPEPAGPSASPDAPAPFTSLDDLRARTGITPDDLRLLVQVGACDTIAGGMSRPMLLWAIDSEQREAGSGKREAERAMSGSRFPLPASRPAIPTLKEYTPDRRRQTEYALLGFTTDSHPMALYRDLLARLRITPSTSLAEHVGHSVLCAGLLTTAKPVSTVKDEPMEFATFDDGAGLIEAVLFPDIYRKRGHVLFDQGPFVFRGKVEQEFGAVTLTITSLDRLERLRPRSP